MGWGIDKLRGRDRRNKDGFYIRINRKLVYIGYMRRTVGTNHCRYPVFDKERGGTHI
jgi:hypothetical protein